LNRCEHDKPALHALLFSQRATYHAALLNFRCLPVSR
jgi:hypothetical protein